MAATAAAINFNCITIQKESTTFKSIIGYFSHGPYNDNGNEIPNFLAGRFAFKENWRDSLTHSLTHSVTRSGNFLDLGQLFKAFGNN